LFGKVLTLLSGVPQHAEGEKKTLRNVVGCRTNDEVNADLANTWCHERGLVCRLADQRDELFLPDACALVLDFNHLFWGRNERAQFVEQLCQALPPYPVAVASYDLDAQEKTALRMRGFLIFRRMDRDLFDELAHIIWCNFAA
jgi:hypothetical protein